MNGPLRPGGGAGGIRTQGHLRSRIPDECTSSGPLCPHRCPQTCFRERPSSSVPGRDSRSQPVGPSCLHRFASRTPSVCAISAEADLRSAKLLRSDSDPNRTLEPSATTRARLGLAVRHPRLRERAADALAATIGKTGVAAWLCCTLRSPSRHKTSFSSARNPPALSRLYPCGLVPPTSQIAENKTAQVAPTPPRAELGLFTSARQSSPSDRNSRFQARSSAGNGSGLGFSLVAFTCAPQRNTGCTSAWAPIPPVGCSSTAAGSNGRSGVHR